MIDRLYLRFQECKGVFTDTRKLIKKGLFFALKGPNFNGNEYAKSALEAGARYAVVDDPAYCKDGRYILVPDTLKALQELALYHRQQLSIPFIGITGSNGKTTSKELINAVLSKKFKTYATQGNLNNHIGVPLTILAIDAEVEIGIIEMGANKPGDIAELCAIALPTHGLITNIGKAHLEGFGGLEGVIKTKTELYRHLQQVNGKVFINSTNHRLQPFISDFESPILYPQSTDFLHCELKGAHPYVEAEVDGLPRFATQLIGAYNFENIAAALCIAKYFEVPMDQAIEAIQAYEPTNNRSQILRKGSNTLILDAYNANPDSMKASIGNFGNMQVGKKMVILGDMLELGEDSVKEHQALGTLVAEQHFGKVVFYGEQMQAALEANPDAYYFTDKFSLRNWLLDLKPQDFHVLIKGSRSMGLEDLVPAFED